MQRRRTLTIGAAALVTVSTIALATAPGAAAKNVTRRATAVAFDESAVVHSWIVGSETVVTVEGSGDDAVLRLPRPLQVRAVEPGGRRVALGTPLPEGATAYEPGGRTSTTLVVADLVTTETRTYELGRNVEPEAFGVGAGRDQLFVVDHRPAVAPESYRVGVVNLTDGAYRGLIGPSKQPLDIDMTGVARKQVSSSDGTQLYTLYLQHAHSDPGHHDPAAHDGTGTVAFVHVLDLGAGWAYCVDLPGVGQGPARASSIALDEDGSHVVVTDRHARVQVSVAVASLRSDQLATVGSPELSVQPIAE